jgi:hypothetical protein
MSQNVAALIEGLLYYAARFSETNEEPADGGCQAAIKNAQAFLANASATEPCARPASCAEERPSREREKAAACADPVSRAKQKPPRELEILVCVGKDFVPEEGDALDAVMAALEFAEIPAYVEQRMADKGPVLARIFMRELLDSVETLGGIVEQHGVSTLTDLTYLQVAIMNGSCIEHRPGESAVLDIVRGLPTGEKWASYIQVEEDEMPAS